MGAIAQALLQDGKTWGDAIEDAIAPMFTDEYTLEDVSDGGEDSCVAFTRYRWSSHKIFKPNDPTPSIEISDLPEKTK